MLDNIKMLLGITDTSKDNIINYYINYYTEMVLEYCHIVALVPALQSIIEQIIFSRFKGSVTKSNTTTEENTNDVKSITRGDYQIVYKDSIADKATSAVLDKYAMPFQGQLNLYRRLDC